MGKKVWNILAPALFWLGLWALGAHLVGRELVLPSPLAVVRTLGQLALTAEFWRSALFSLGRVLWGFFLGSALGMALGALTAAFDWWDRLISPALRAVRTVPVVSFILLLFFWLPKQQIPATVAALMALPVVWRSTRQGLAAADPQLLEMADHYALGRWRTFRLVRLPAALPALCAGWETALGLCWKSGVAAEVICQPRWAAGTALQTAKAYLDAPALFAWTGMVVALSLALEWALRRALKPWREGEGT